MPSARRCSASLALLAAAGLLGACAEESRLPEVDPSSRRSLPAGDVVGFTGHYGSHVWKGLPFAAPPVGERRWRAPEPPPRWDGVREALASGDACPQLASVYAGGERGAEGVIGDEDCLTLDVYAPRRNPGASAALPVMVWIHGGGNSIGRAGFYDGGNLAATHDVVVVAVQYRLGPLGWFRHASLRGDGASAADRSGNYGTLDLVRALQWVRDNITPFGGDPGNVTIFGESAGGRNVLSLLLSPAAEGLFHRAIVQSGAARVTSFAEAENFARDPKPGHGHSSNEILTTLLVRSGRAIDRSVARRALLSMSDAEVASFARDRTPEELLDAYADEGAELQGMIEFPQMFPDGVVQAAGEPMALLAEGRYHRVPVMLGTNRDEEKIFMVFDPVVATWRFGLFPQARDRDRYQAQAEHLSHAGKAQMVDRPASLMRGAQGASVFAYRWDWDEEPGVPLLYDGGFMIGAAHGLEIPFVFGHFDLGPQSHRLFDGGNEEGRLALSAQMMSYWAQFASAGAPGRGRAGDLLEWTAWDDARPDASRYLVLDTPADGGLHLASETWTIDRVLREITADPRLDEGRCYVLAQLLEGNYAWRAQIARAAAGECDWPGDEIGSEVAAGS